MRGRVVWCLFGVGGLGVFGVYGLGVRPEFLGLGAGMTRTGRSHDKNWAPACHSIICNSTFWVKIGRLNHSLSDKHLFSRLIFRIFWNKEFVFWKKEPWKLIISALRVLILYSSYEILTFFTMIFVVLFVGEIVTRNYYDFLGFLAEKIINSCRRTQTARSAYSTSRISLWLAFFP